MSYTFPKDTRWELHGAHYRTKFTISINQILSCDYVNGYRYNYYNIRTRTSYFAIFTDRIPEFEAMFHKFPYDCLEYIAKLEEKIDNNNNKRIETLETNLNNLLTLIEKLSANANNLLKN